MKLLGDSEIKHWVKPEMLSWLTHIDKASVEFALDGFDLKTDKSTRWLVAQVRHAFFCSVGSNINGYPGNLSVRRELEGIANSLAVAQNALASRSEWAESLLRRSLMIKDEKNADWFPIENMVRKTRLEDWWSSGNEMFRSEFAEWRRFDDATKELVFVQDFILSAIREICSNDDPPRWRDKNRRKERIGLAVWLSPVFEAAYKKRATVNNWTHEDGVLRLGNWPDFFNRIGPMALGITRIPDLTAVLKTARKTYLRYQ